jgi:hypothetical protein
MILCLNNVHDINVQIIQIDEWHGHVYSIRTYEK